MIVSGIHRLELIDHRACRSCNGHKLVRVEGQNEPIECPACQGRGIIGRLSVPLYNPTNVEFSLQDDNKTVKIFVSEAQQ